MKGPSQSVGSFHFPRAAHSDDLRERGGQQLIAATIGRGLCLGWLLPFVTGRADRDKRQVDAAFCQN